jgi:mRNA-degrading endonuclease toxin of MazEF toxin-antitoxin module
VKSEDVRSVSKDRLVRCMGKVEDHTMEFVGLRIKTLLQL